MKNYIQTAREAMKNPEDANLVEAANSAADRLRVPLYEMKKYCNFLFFSFFALLLNLLIFFFLI